MIKVLLADDHSIVREGLRRIVEESGNLEVVAEAADGREALKQVAELAPDVAVVDISMPGIDGLEVARRLKQKEKTSHIPIIMLTALGWIPAWIVCIIIGREIAITGLRNIIAQKGKDLSASSLGKYKTGFQIAAIIPLMIHFSYLTIDFHAIGAIFLWVALALTVWSGAAYFIRYRSFLKA